LNHYAWNIVGDRRLMCISMDVESVDKKLEIYQSYDTTLV